MMVKTSHTDINETPLRLEAALLKHSALGRVRAENGLPQGTYTTE
jgi:hypothetical protein